MFASSAGMGRGERPPGCAWHGLLCAKEHRTSRLLIPTAQVLPADVDYRVMLTFLDFYHTLLQFVLFKLYHALGVRYPPQVDPRLEEAAAGLTAIMQVCVPRGRSAVERACPAGSR